MTTPALFRDSVLKAKQQLIAAREEVRLQHAAGSPGIQVCAHLTDLLDGILQGVFDAIASEITPPGGTSWDEIVTLVAHGGYGRRDVAPYSDVDVMILHEPGYEAAVEPVAKAFLRDVFDAGFELGQSVRTPKEACRLATEDATIATSLMESRRLLGSEELFNQFSAKFLRKIRGKRRTLLPSIENARRDERNQFGETVYMLEPNIKRSRGGLRDLQLLRWIGFTRYGVTDPKELQLLGHLSTRDLSTIQLTYEYLLHLRNELHFHAGKPNDILDRAEQMRIANLRGFEGKEGILPVEQFMSEYFRNTHAARSVVAEFAAAHRLGNRWEQVMGHLFSHYVDGGYRVTGRQIIAGPRAIRRLETDLCEVLRLADLANRYNARIAPATWQAARQAVPKIAGPTSAEAVQAFLSLISEPAQLGELLRRLHELGVLEKIIPAYKHARSLLQFNEYHKYTVDEHCILAVQRATEFLSDPGPLGVVYRRIKQKRTLHLALLIHDLGKGFVEDHSEVGLRIAAETAPLLRLPLREAEAVKFLVHKHLVMAHLAMWRDTTDEQLIIKFAIEVGSPEILDMLYILTAADISAVGPGVWNRWKAELITNLHQKTMQHLAGDSEMLASDERLAKRRDAVRETLHGVDDRTWYDRLLESLPANYLQRGMPSEVALDLRHLHSLAPGEVHAWGRYQPESRTVEFSVATHEDVVPGIFHRLTGALSAQGLQILTAEIHTLIEGIVFDRFSVHDPDHANEPPPHRIEEVNAALVDALKSPSANAPSFRRLWRMPGQATAVATAPAQVRIDNSTSEKFTIIDVFATDRMALLHTITRTLFELELSVGVAKIGTHLDQVVDVFYVTDSQGNKLEDEARLQQIRERVLAAIEEMPN